LAVIVTYDVEHLDRLAVGQLSFLDLLANFRGSAGLQVGAYAHAVERLGDALRWASAASS
jgi:hypothetical protein